MSQLRPTGLRAGGWGLVRPQIWVPAGPACARTPRGPQEPGGAGGEAGVAHRWHLKPQGGVRPPRGGSVSRVLRTQGSDCPAAAPQSPRAREDRGHVGEAGAPHRRERGRPLALCFSAPGGPVCPGPRRASSGDSAGPPPSGGQPWWPHTPHPGHHASPRGGSPCSTMTRPDPGSRNSGC